MSKLKKGLISVVAAAMIATNVVGLASCGGGNNKINFNENASVVAYDGSAVTVTFYHTMGQTLKEILDDYLKDFNELYPNITVKHTSPTNDYDELREQISTKLSQQTAPSMAFCYPDHVALYNTFKAVVPLDDYMNSTLEVTDGKGNKTQLGLTQAEKDSYFEPYFAEGSIFGDGKTYTLPYLKSTEVLYYNKTYFREHNLLQLDEMDRPLTWDELWALCAQIKEIENNDEYVIPFGYDNEANWFITMTEQLKEPYTSVDGDRFLFNTANNRAFVEELRTYYQMDYFTTKELNGGTYTSNLFNQGAMKNVMRCYMCVGSTGGSSYQTPSLDSNGKDPFEVGVAMVPQMSENEADYKVLQQGPSVCIFKQNDPQEVAASWLLAKFLTTSIGYQASASTNNGYTPVIKTVLENEYFQADLEAAKQSTLNADLPKKTISQALSQMEYYYTSPAFNGSSAAREYVGYLMESCLSGSLGSQTAAQFIASVFEDTIDTLQYKFPN